MTPSSRVKHERPVNVKTTVRARCCSRRALFGSLRAATEVGLSLPTPRVDERKWYMPPSSSSKDISVSSLTHGGR